MLDTIIYIMIFMMGTVLGSFFTLAVYRIPLKKDITHERSFCPNCNHRLEFLDLIPVLSYIFLGGKCRYCKEKIRPRYLILEISSGILFLLFFLSFKICIFDILNFNISKIGLLIYGIFYISTLIIIGGIEKEKHYVPNSLFIFSLIISLIYIIYLYILNVSIYKYVIYFVLMIVLTIINIITSKKNKNSYILNVLWLILFMLISTIEEIVLLSTIIAGIIYLFTLLFKLKKEDKNIPIIFYLCFTNIIILIISNFI